MTPHRVQQGLLIFLVVALIFGLVIGGTIGVVIVALFDITAMVFFLVMAFSTRARRWFSS